MSSCTYFEFSWIHIGNSKCIVWYPECFHGKINTLYLKGKNIHILLIDTHKITKRILNKNLSQGLKHPWHVRKIILLIDIKTTKKLSYEQEELLWHAQLRGLVFMKVMPNWSFTNQRKYTHKIEKANKVGRIKITDNKFFKVLGT